MTINTEESTLPVETEVFSTRPALRVPKGRLTRNTWKRRLLDVLAAPLQACFGPRERDAFGILMYHRVTNPPPGHPVPTWNVTPERFEAQLAGLLARGWQAWPLSQVLRWAEQSLPIPRRAFVVTFDDGYANNLLSAHPILTRLHVPATVFLATAYLDRREPFPSDDWSVAGKPGVPSETWRPLTTAECHRLTANGLVELGAHTHTHADFRGRPADFVADLEQNLAILRDVFGALEPAFAFPYGTKGDGFATPELAQAARDAGVTCCLTTEEAIVRAGDDPFDWGRFAPDQYDSAPTLAAQLGNWQPTLRRLARAVVRRSKQ